MGFQVAKIVAGLMLVMSGLYQGLGYYDPSTYGAATPAKALAGLALVLAGAVVFFKKLTPFNFFRIATGGIAVALSIVFGEHGIRQLIFRDNADITSKGSVGGAAVLVALCLALLVGYYLALWTKSGIRRNLENIFSIPELTSKIVFTIALLAIYRIGFHVPLPGVDQNQLADLAERQQGGGSPFGEALQYFSMFTGGNLTQSTLFGLGIMPYISASIIFMLLVNIYKPLEKLQKEGPAGQKKIQEYTRYATVILCLVQSFMLIQFLFAKNLVYPEFSTGFNRVLVTLFGMVGLTGGTMFLMWIGEQIDEYGLGNGISLLIMAGIVVRLPAAIGSLYQSVESGKVGALGLVVLAVSFVGVVAGSILITQAQRRIKIQQAKQTRGRRVYGGMSHYMPLRVNHGGVMPIIFASSLMIFPGIIAKVIADKWNNGVTTTIADSLTSGSFTHTLIFVGMIFFFAYFWTTVNFRPKQMADQLRDMGHFIPGLRPGKRTSDYLERVMERITYCGAGFLAVIAVLPMVITSSMGIDFVISSFLGGTGLLIMVSVALDMVQRIESNLVMRNYGGFLASGTKIKGAYA